MQKQTLIRKLASAATAVAMGALMIPQISFAGSLGSKSVVPSNNKISTASNYTVYFAGQSGVSASQTVTITFGSADTDFTEASVDALDFADIDVATSDAGTSNCSAQTDYTERTVAASTAAATWGATTATRVVTLVAPSSGAGTVGAFQCVRVELGTHATTGSTGDSQITNGSSTGSKTVTINTTSDTTSGEAYVPLVTDGDVIVSGTVAGSITLGVSDIAVSLGTLSSSSVATSATDSGSISVATNAESGFVLQAYTPTGLRHSGYSVNGHTISAQTSEGTGTTGSEEWGITFVEASETQNSVVSTVASLDGAYDEYNGTAASSKFMIDTSAADTVASSTAGVSATYTMHAYATIGANTEAGTYSGTVRLTAYAKF